MRISSLYNSNAMLTQMGTNGTRLSKLLEQVSTLKRINVPSDDPVAASRLVQLNREESAITQYQSNIKRLSGALAIQESNVNALNNQLLSLNDKLLSANNSTHSQKDMAGYGAEIDSMIDSLVASMNAKNENGSYLFSGTKTDSKTVTLDENGQYVYGGNDGTRETQVANGVSITENTNVAQAFSGSGNDLKVLNDLKALSAKMQDPDASYADYKDEIDAMLGSVQGARDRVSSIFTDLGGRQNRLTLLGDAHTDVSVANRQLASELGDTDEVTATTNLQLYAQSMQISYKTYSMVSQLNLFSMM
ncbi:MULTISPECIES: flagellar hook-associated protein FlgL [Citrobacter]|uniref:Flagellar hook-associated protein FlgL n=1 Tax=Citrobacter sedlakii TaxID=67826 RepID=A0ABS0ZRR8_9ENTR|nr:MULTISPECIES: flagellar hook-associated protein FlgL [Citrobacter]EHG7580648.1 flagellar hook-associated protein 3 [Citrobacter sedlakii]EIQ7158360.1 flagellar hook-associated protein FlgL [Citrobacter sedlakii]MBJ8381516.1 flagellar hook-associated protein FlgL [Citrobacter sedlakii]MBM9568396.1 flagellar hook-associated protein FlgL [Citrobacter sedlakii]MBN6597365.1 flagellar hook-associated protein FlgL [Citrobacter sedlakii]